MNLIFNHPFKVMILLLVSSSIVGTFVLTNKEPHIGPSDSQVINDTREHWQQLSLSEVELKSITVDNRDVIAADRVRFELSLVYQPGSKQTEQHKKYSVSYRLFENTWREHRY